MDRKRLAVSILQFLKSTLPSLSEDSAESLSVSIDCIRDAFGVDESDVQLQSSQSLQEIFNAHAAPATTSTTSTSSLPDLLKEIMSDIPDQLHPSFKSYIDILQSKNAFADPSQIETVLKFSKEKFVESKMTEIKAIAEAIKVEGNTKLSAQDFQGAVEAYTKAIKYDGSNAIYYANRSSAFTNLKMFDNAVQDANEAIKRNPSYGKAYFRLGSALFSLGQNQESVDAFRKSIELEPNNEVYKASLQQAESKLGSVGSVSSPPAGGMPDLGGMDLGNLSGLLSNPMMQNMAKNLMSNPQMQQMMQNGNLEDMAQNMMKNPEFMNMFGSMMD
ncbi:tetratricopeptide-like helical domain-containing protein [Cavenderia fasciculata]|uniref:Tetratricopeptide-like helical domain-containing protein n=1 Tax=Cavenderia fasciculata TaxID=261658 RepID=F4PZN4_CACFS|nr:tetratricopeptide-like helical domain-containing protein [Cavenderia fasciculata]EGG18798.1 tetratricopeptide-like helical domain-containing protein [Cavenderia fasciculata]|eukprot:XP_004357260.1 tetratricopeptide-like helical domain-containing protein [Cavenderia fasciculata]